MTFKYLGLARFIGRDGSLGFRCGQIYEIRAYTRLDGLVMLMFRGKGCPYKNEGKLKQNWELLDEK